MCKRIVIELPYRFGLSFFEGKFIHFRACDYQRDLRANLADRVQAIFGEDAVVEVTWGREKRVLLDGPVLGRQWALFQVEQLLEQAIVDLDPAPYHRVF